MLMQAVPWVSLGLWLIWIGYTGWLWRNHNFKEAFQKVWAMPWGKQMTFDLWLALLGFGVVVFLNEPNPWVAAAWVLSSLLLGNLALPLPYLFFRWELLLSHFS